MIEKLKWKYNRDRNWWELKDKINEIIEVVNEAMDEKPPK